RPRRTSPARAAPARTRAAERAGPAPPSARMAADRGSMRRRAREARGPRRARLSGRYQPLPWLSGPAALGVADADADAAVPPEVDGDAASFFSSGHPARTTPTVASMTKARRFRMRRAYHGAAPPQRRATTNATPPRMAT